MNVGPITVATPFVVAMGMVISSINARGESRTYAKGLLEGLSETTLTLEEEQALAVAHQGRVA